MEFVHNRTNRVRKRTMFCLLEESVIFYRVYVHLEVVGPCVIEVDVSSKDFLIFFEITF